MDKSCIVYDKKRYDDRMRPAPASLMCDTPAFYPGEAQTAAPVRLSRAMIDNGLRDMFANAPIREFDSFLLCHIYRGEGRLYLANEKSEIRMPEGSIAIIMPHVPHIYGGVTGDYREDYIAFDGVEIERMAQAGLIQTCCVPYGQYRKLPEIDAMLQILSPEYYLRAKLALEELLLEVHNIRLNHARFAKVSQMLEAMAAHPEKPWSVEDMADFCGCSTAQVRRNLFQYTGMLPKQCVEHIRFQRAAEALSLTDTPIMQIALQAGFPDRFHFSRRFSAYFGIAPGQYRLQTQGKSTLSKGEKA